MEYVRYNEYTGQPYTNTKRIVGMMDNQVIWENSTSDGSNWTYISNYNYMNEPEIIYREKELPSVVKRMKQFKSTKLMMNYINALFIIRLARQIKRCQKGVSNEMSLGEKDN